MKFEIRTFRDVTERDMDLYFGQICPSVFNGDVRVEKFRITVEKIKEDEEVYRNRLQKLWEHSSNHHNHGPLMREAARLGVKLTGEMGDKCQ